MSVAIEFSVEAPGWSSVPDAERTIRRAIEAALGDAGAPDSEIGVVLTDDARIRVLNREWRGKDEATNVLSFPVADHGQAAPRLLGDVVIALETIRREAAAANRALERHLAHLAVHGALHLLGFDHAGNDEADAMETRERRILAQIGVPDPYDAAEPKRTEPA